MNLKKVSSKIEMAIGEINEGQMRTCDWFIRATCAKYRLDESYIRKIADLKRNT